ncbi:MAG: uncharacterized membrane protein YuzA (DUF378 family) [Candidatus Nanohaloarchaea archaeon]
MRGDGKISVWDIISTDPFFGLHFAFSLLLVIPALIGFPSFQNIISSLSIPVGISVSVFYIIFSLPTIVEVSQSWFRTVKRPETHLSLGSAVIIVPAVFWLSMGLFELNLIDQIAVSLGTPTSFLYLVAAFLPLYPVIT